MNTVGIRNSAQTTRNYSMHLIGLVFGFLGRVGGVEFLGFRLFPICSEHISPNFQCVPPTCSQ